MRCYATEKLTCVGRYTGIALRLDGKSFHYAAYRDGMTEDLYITVGWADEAETADIRSYVTLQLDSGTVPFDIMEGWDTPVCRIPWDTEEDRVFIAKKGSWFTMTSGAIETDVIRVYQRRFESLPVFAMEPVLYAGYTHTLTWELTPGDGRTGWVTGVNLRQRKPDDTDFTEQTLAENRRMTSCRVTLGEEVLGSDVCLVMEYRTFPADWDGSDTEDFVTLNRYVTPVQRVSRNAAIPLAPAQIGTTLLIDGGKVTVSWTAVNDPVNTIEAYRLERAGKEKDGSLSGYSILYSGASDRFRDTLPEGLEGVRYRVCAVNTAGTASPWTDSGFLEVAKSNIYVGVNGKWIRAAAVQIGSRKASPMAVVM